MGAQDLRLFTGAPRNNIDKPTPMSYNIVYSPLAQLVRIQQGEPLNV